MDIFGSSFYCGGIFDSKEKAENYVKTKNASLPKELFFTIHEINLNEGLEITRTFDGYECETDVYIGSYIE